MVRIPPGRLKGAKKVYRGQEYEVRFPYAMEVAKSPVTWSDWDAAIAAGADLPRDLPRQKKPPGTREGHFACVPFGFAQAYVDYLNERLGLLGKGDRFRLPLGGEWAYAIGGGADAQPPTNPWGLRDIVEKLWHQEAAQWVTYDGSLYQPRYVDDRYSDKTIGFRLFRSLKPTEAELAAYEPFRLTGRAYKYDLFLSHNQRDGSLALKATLEARGLSVWHDNDADMSNQKVQQLVSEAIYNSRLLCVCIGPEYRDSRWVQAEYRAMGADVIVLLMRGGGSIPGEISNKTRFTDQKLDDLEAYLRVANTADDFGGAAWQINEANGNALRRGADRERPLPKLMINAIETSKLAVGYGTSLSPLYEAAVASNDEAEIERVWCELYTSRGYDASTIAKRRFEEAFNASAGEDVLAKRWGEMFTFSRRALSGSQTRYSADYAPIEIGALGAARYRQRQAAGALPEELSALWDSLYGERSFELFLLGFELGLSAWELQSHIAGFDEIETMRKMVERYAKGDAESEKILIEIDQCLTAFETLLVEGASRFPPHEYSVCGDYIEALAEVFVLAERRERAGKLLEPLLAVSLVGRDDAYEHARRGEICTFGRAMYAAGSDAAGIRKARARYEYGKEYGWMAWSERDLAPPPKPWWRFWF
ncbi:MAG: TIR domain-containing protein [Hyphomonadaceae bacterium]